VLRKNNTWKILELFLQNPERSFHIREIARLVSLSPPSVSKIVAELKKDGLLVSKKEKMVENVSAPRTEKFVWLKRSYNLHSLYGSGLVDFLRKEYQEPEAIVLFGSYAMGEDTSKSDIDIGIVTDEAKELDLQKFERILGRKINVHEIQLKRCEKEFLNNIINGIVLYGCLKVL